jgi:hypothetical protein
MSLLKWRSVVKRDSRPTSSLAISLVMWLGLFILGIFAGCSDQGQNTTNNQNTTLVRTTSPGRFAKNVAVNSSIAVTFTQDINSATVTTTSFYLRDTANNLVEGTILCGQKSATFSPLGPLSYQTTYIATVTKSVAASNGAMGTSDYSWQFSTAAQEVGTISFQTATSISTGSWPEAVAIGDVTGSGKNSVLLITSFNFDPANDYKIFLFTQNGSGSLNTAKTYTCSGIPKSIAIGDINGDGKNEVVIGNDRQNIEIFVQDGSGGLVSSGVITTSHFLKFRLAGDNFCLPRKYPEWGMDINPFYVIWCGSKMNPVVNAFFLSPTAIFSPTGCDGVFAPFAVNFFYS